jgi:prepilin-type N-terminal cleavage/methylation domain-containing protein/prepilin-type processing-associated H-X9-DG protein
MKRQLYIPSIFTTHPSRRPGFTLIELLVVTTIIGVLISLILPSLSKARDKAKELRCAANLKQISTAMALYRADNADRQVAGRINYDPGATTWMHILGQGTGSTNTLLRGQFYYQDYWVLRCPMGDYSTGSQIFIFNNCSMVQWNFQTGVGNPGPKGAPIAANNTPGNKWLRLSDYKYPNNVIQLLDTQSPSSWQCAWSSGVRYWATGTGPNPSRVGAWHDRGTNILWLDGRVTWLAVNSSYFVPSSSLDVIDVPF